MSFDVASGVLSYSCSTSVSVAPVTGLTLTLLLQWLNKKKGSQNEILLQTVTLFKNVNEF